MKTHLDNRHNVVGMDPHSLSEDEKARDYPNTQNSNVECEKLESVAIVGLALKFPQDATNPETSGNFLLRAGPR